jgi:hypothetical protein
MSVREELNITTGTCKQTLPVSVPNQLYGIIRYHKSEFPDLTSMFYRSDILSSHAQIIR